ncbi:MAG: flap endonuclease-1 [Nanoarchaeota archaeon]
MGVNLRDIIIRKPITLEELKGKIIVIDSFNILFQFLTTIRSREGNLLTDSKGNVTSHLIGLFSRTANFMQHGIKPVFVFDGVHPELKHKEIERRIEIKQEAQKKYEQAKAQEDVELMKKYAARTTRLTPQMIDEAKKLVTLLGLPVIQAPSEGEAQASFIVKQGDGWAVSSQDYDSILYATPRLIQNLSIAGKRKKTKTLATVIVSPELIDLKENLQNIGVTQDQLIAIAMLVGTDYNIGGVKGIGPKNAIKLVKKHGLNFEQLFEEVKWSEHCETSWRDVFKMFKEMPVEKEYKIKFNSVDVEGLKKFLIEERDFGAERVEKTLEPLLKQEKNKNQKGLFDF